LADALRAGDIRAEAGEVKYGPVASFELRDCTKVELPVILVNGAEEGPTLVITAVVHPPELAGIEVVRRITREEVDPMKLKGSIIAFPISNPIGIQFGEYVTPHDGVNLSKAFPGKEDGSITERVAYAIRKHGIEERKPSCVVDLHSNMHPCIVFSIVRREGTEAVQQESVRLARAFGATVIRSGTQMTATFTPGVSLTGRCMTNDISAMTVELAGSTTLDMNTVEVGVQGMLNVMKALKMIDGEIEEQKDIKVLPGDYSFYEMVKTNRGGIFHRLVEPGEKLSKGDNIGKVYNFYGEVVEEVRMPVDGYIWAFPIESYRAVPTATVEEGSNVSFVFTD